MSKLFALWSYDLFPRCLGAEVTKIEDDSYTVNGYGRIRRTERVLLVPAKVGKALTDELTALREERTKRLAEVEAEFSKKLDDAFKRAGVCRPGSK